MIFQKKAFSLIELLVTIVIIGILATVSITTFSGYFERANNSKRESLVNTAAHIIKVEDSAVSDGEKKYLFGDRNDDLSAIERKTLHKVLSEQDVNISSFHPKKNTNICFFYGYTLNGGIAGDPTRNIQDNHYFVASWRILDGGSTGMVIVDGTDLGVKTLNSMDLTINDFLARGGECPEDSALYGLNWTVFEILDDNQE